MGVKGPHRSEGAFGGRGVHGGNAEVFFYARIAVNVVQNAV